MLTQQEFVTYVTSRVMSGESMEAVGASLGVSKMAVSRWIYGARVPSRTVLVLASS